MKNMTDINEALFQWVYKANKGEVYEDDLSVDIACDRSDEIIYNAQELFDILEQLDSDAINIASILFRPDLCKIEEDSLAGEAAIVASRISYYTTVKAVAFSMSKSSEEVEDMIDTAFLKRKKEA